MYSASVEAVERQMLVVGRKMGVVHDVSVVDDMVHPMINIHIVMLVTPAPSQGVHP